MPHRKTLDDKREILTSHDSRLTFEVQNPAFAAQRAGVQVSDMPKAFLWNKSRRREEQKLVT